MAAMRGVAWPAAAGGGAIWPGPHMFPAVSHLMPGAAAAAAEAPAPARRGGGTPATWPAGAALLTPALAEQLQDMLMEEYLEEDFQRRLHQGFEEAGEDLLARARSRQAICLPVQCQVIPLFGFEASRAGVAKCVRMFDTERLNDHPRISERSDSLTWLVKPEEQRSKPMPRMVRQRKEQRSQERAERAARDLARTTEEAEERLDAVLESFNLEGIARYVLEHKCRRIVVMCGAGISTSAGIPDFRSPGTGLYSNLQRFDLPTPESIFDLRFFRRNPRPFYELAKEIWPGRYSPTPAHYFIRMLHDKGILLRCYSQNIDSLERQARLPAERLVAAHGNFDAAHVIDTDPEVEVDASELKVALEVEGEEGWQALRERMGDLVKPKMVFFGEELPPRWTQLHEQDLANCDLLIVLGTSLVVEPFSGLLSLACRTAPRLLINSEAAGTCDRLRRGFRFRCEEDGDNWRDVWHEGDCDGGCRALACALGWRADLEALISSSGSAVADRAPWAPDDPPLDWGKVSEAGDPAQEGASVGACTGSSVDDGWDPWGG